jgi:hypothetical protein
MAEAEAREPVDAARSRSSLAQWLRRHGPQQALPVALALAFATAAALAWWRAGWQELGPDDAAYLLVGQNVLAGNGPVRFGEPYIARSPLFGILLALPGALGAPIISGAHVVNLLITVAACLAAGLLAARIAGPWWGLLGLAIALLMPLPADLASTLRIDSLAAATLLLAYTASLGLGAAQPRWWLTAAATGLLIGLAFLVKETTLASSLGPLLVPLVRGFPLRAVARDTLVAGASALLLAAPWMAWRATVTGRLPYIPLPGPAILPVVVIAALVLAFALARRSALQGPASVERPSPARLLVGVGLVLAWAAAVTLVAVSATGTRIVPEGPLELATRLTRAVPAWPLIVSAALACLALSLRRPRLAPPGLGIIAWLPVGWLVLTQDLGSRNFIAVEMLGAAAIAVVAGFGWDLLVRRWGSGAGPWRSPRATAMMAVSPALAAILLGVLSVSVAFARGPVADGAQDLDGPLRRLAGAIESVVKPGDRVVVGWTYSSYLDLLVPPDYQLRRMRPGRVDARSGSPTGLVRGSGQPVSEVAGLAYQTRARMLLAFEPARMADLLGSSQVTYLVYIPHHIYTPRWMLPLFVPERGFTEVGRHEISASRTAYVYRIDPQRLELSGSPVLIDVPSLEATLDELQQTLRADELPAAVGALFANGVEIPDPDTPEERAVLDRLAALMAGS